MRLALRKTNSPTLFGNLFNTLTRWRLHTEYPHAGIVIDGELYHSTYSEGLHKVPFDPQGWELFDVKGSDHYVRAVFNARKGARRMTQSVCSLSCCLGGCAIRGASTATNGAGWQ